MPDKARDYFERYYAEKLWALIPAVYRHEDGIAANPGVLRAFVEILAEQAAILRRSHDRLWEDQFIELCDDWVVPYLGDLVATRLVSALNLRGRRVDVAKTIYYRRRKGTLRVLEELIGDIAGWEGVVVELFRRLGRTRHGLDPAPGKLAGRLTGALPGGWADLRRPHGAALAGSPFDEFHHTADMRRHRGVDGRYAIPKLAFYLYRLRVLRVEGVTPHARAGNLTFTFDPSGRDVPLYMPRNRAQDAGTLAGQPRDWDAWRQALEWELPAPMHCRVLGHAEYLIDEALVQQLVSAGLASAAADDLRTLRGVRFVSEARLRETLATLPQHAALLAPAVYASLLAGALVADCGKQALLPGAVLVEDAPGVAVPPVQTAAGNLRDWVANAAVERVVIDPERGRLLFAVGGPPAAGSSVTYHYAFSGEIGAGTYSRGRVESRTPSFTHQDGGAVPSAGLANDGVTQLEDSATYGPIGDKLQVRDLTLQAANQQRPYVRLESNWVLNTGAGNQESELLLDGLWLGAAGNFAVILRGDYERVTIRSCTFDPGGSDADGNVIPPVPLVIEANVEELVIEQSIMGPIRTHAGGDVARLVVEDSIVQSQVHGVAALALPAGEARMNRVTVFGEVDVHRLWASEALLVGRVDVTDTQAGCFRFSAAPRGSRLPRPYQSHWIAASGHLFTSRRFGQPGYAQLSEAAPPELLRGAENGSEIGAFSALLNPVKLDSLLAKVAEYSPFGLIPIVIPETQEEGHGH